MRRERGSRDSVAIRAFVTIVQTFRLIQKEKFFLHMSFCVFICLHLNVNGVFIYVVDV
jgi:hypothetical protein